jgi:hypothetical protein
MFFMSVLTATRCFFCFEWRIPFCFDLDLLVFFEIDHVLKIEMSKKSDAPSKILIKDGAGDD